MQPRTLLVDSVELAFDNRKILQDVALQCSQGATGLVNHPY